MKRRLNPRLVSAFLTPFAADRLRQALEAQEAWGPHLASYMWHHFGTLTFRHSTAPPAAVRSCQTWRRRLAQRAQQRVYWFWVLERGAAGLLHLHVLTAGTGHLEAAALERAWPFGRADATTYDPARGSQFAAAIDKCIFGQI